MPPATRLGPSGAIRFFERTLWKASPTPIRIAMPDDIFLNETAYTVWQTVKEQGPIELGEVARFRYRSSSGFGRGDGSNHGGFFEVFNTSNTN